MSGHFSTSPQLPPVLYPHSYPQRYPLLLPHDIHRTASRSTPRFWISFGRRTCGPAVDVRMGRSACHKRSSLSHVEKAAHGSLSREVWGESDTQGVLALVPFGRCSRTLFVGTGSGRDTRGLSAPGSARGDGPL